MGSRMAEGAAEPGLGRPGRVPGPDRTAGRGRVAVPSRSPGPAVARAGRAARPPTRPNDHRRLGAPGDPPGPRAVRRIPAGRDRRHDQQPDSRVAGGGARRPGIVAVLPGGPGYLAVEAAEATGRGLRPPAGDEY